MRSPSVQPGLTAPILRTERLCLRPFRIEDFDAFAALYASSRSRHIDGPVPRPRAWLLFATGVGQWPLLGFGSWAVERESDGRCVGGIGLNHPVQFPERELGWVLWADEFEGQGYATEAAVRARRFAFEDLGWETLVSYIDPANHASIRIAERLGAVLDPNAQTPLDDPALVYRHPRPAR